ncbi:cellulose biosynthesis protein BcsG [Burkholderiaceae bacterium DAT-1]|nr:cellulose biosynthesis protein BcsG [Burkholderiaceae bacterium DAT-1]
MSAWNIYFIAKFILYFGNFIDFHLLPNLLLAISVYFPLKALRWRQARLIVAIPCAIALFYHDTWFPPVGRVLSQAGYMNSFSPAYMLELAGRLVNLNLLAVLITGALIYWIVRRWLRISAFVIATMVTIVPAWSLRDHLAALATTHSARAGQATAVQTSDDNTPSASAADSATIEAASKRFFTSEKNRVLATPQANPSDVPFDIIVIQVCSLAWDDMKFVNLEQPALFGKFDLLFTQFSSGASYSGPAAIRLMRSSCGQMSHKDLYGATNPGCFLFQNLDQAGFPTQFAMNHDGHFGRFLDDLRQHGNLNASPIEINDTSVYLKAFDDTPIRDDYAVLEKWWKSRLALPNPRVALYYNTISLHDGNHYPGTSTGDSVKIYRPRLEKLLSDIDKFSHLVEASGRNAALVFVPEHGAALRGDKMQISGLREIPAPSISLIPVGVRLLGKQVNHGSSPVLVDTPSSYLALAQLLYGMAAKSPFADSVKISDYTHGLARTQFASDNGGIMVFKYQGRYYLHNTGEDWQEYRQ